MKRLTCVAVLSLEGGYKDMSKFTIDVLELAAKQGRAVTSSTMFSLAIAESSLNKREYVKKSYDAAVVFAASMQPHLLDEWVRACYANESPLSRGHVEIFRHIYPDSYDTEGYAKAYAAGLHLGFVDPNKVATQRQILKNLVAEAHGILEKEKA